MKANSIDRIEKGTAKVEMSERRNFLKIGGAALIAASAFPSSTFRWGQRDLSSAIACAPR